jgi:modulator of FtsH protease
MTVPADWADFAEVIGTSSGALTGLLFVAVSLNASRIEGHRGLRASAAQTLVLFLTPLIIAAALLAPGQADWVFGAELIAIGLVSSWVLLSIGRLKQTLDDDERSLVEIFNRRTPNIIVMLLFVASGTVLVCGENDGLYLLLPASLIAFISGVVNAWYFLLPPPKEPQGPKGHPGGPREPKAASESP